MCVSVLTFFKHKTFSCMREVCTCMHVHMCERGYMSTVAQEWRSDGNPGCLASPSSWLETSSLVVHCCAHQASWPLRLQGFCYLHPHLTIGKLGLLNFMQMLGIQTQVLTLVQPLFSHGAISSALTSFTQQDVSRVHLCYITSQDSVPFHFCI